MLRTYINSPSQSKINKVNGLTIAASAIVAALTYFNVTDPETVAEVNQLLVVATPVVTVILRSFFTANN